MSTPQIIAFTAGVAVLVFMAYWTATARCRWFGHAWYRASAWSRTFKCQHCGTMRKEP